MRWLSVRLRGEEGFSLVLIGILLIVLIALTGFAVDAGAMYQERRELRNGADAAALAIAEECAEGLPCTVADRTGTAETYTEANVEDGDAKGGQQGVDNAVFPQRMEIDYVRVYQLGPANASGSADPTE